MSIDLVSFGLSPKRSVERSPSARPGSCWGVPTANWAIEGLCSALYEMIVFKFRL